MDHQAPIICDTWARCLEHDGQRVALTGIYTLHRPLRGMKGGQDVVRVRIIPAGDRRGAYLAPYWHPDSTRSHAEQAQLEGHRVRVVGRLWLTAPSPPNPNASTMGGACIHPIEHIELAPEVPSAAPH